MLDKLHVITSILAAIVVTLLSINQQITLQELSVRLITVIIAFYVLGLGAKIYLKRFVFPKPMPEAVAEEVGAEPGEGETQGMPPGQDNIFEEITGMAQANERSKYD